MVENPEPDFTTPSLVLTEPPVMVVGIDKQDSLGGLWTVSGLALSPVGNLALISAGYEVHIYSPQGVLLRKLGRIGDGPGEFRRPRALTFRDDESVVVWDLGLKRLNVYSKDGGVISTTDINFPTYQAFCCAGTGAVLLLLTEPGIEVSGGRTSQWALVHPLGGPATPEVLPTFVAPASEPSSGERVNVARRGVPGTMILSQLFARQASISIGGDRIVAASGADFAFDVLLPASGASHAVRTRAAPAAPTEEQVSAAREELLTNLVLDGATREAAAAVLARLKVPVALPAVGKLRVEEDGTTWVAAYSPPRDTAPEKWARFGVDGKLQGTLLIPRDRTLMKFTRGHAVIGRAPDADGFVRVQVHRITGG